MKKEIIGYKLKDETYRKAANSIAGYIEGGAIKLEEFILNSGVFRDNLEKAGILDLWFTPVYKEENIFELNKWHKENDCWGDEMLFFPTEIEVDGDILGYGIDGQGDWTECGIWGYKDEFKGVPATKDEVEVALVNEMNKRYTTGDEIKLINRRGGTFEISEGFAYSLSSNYLAHNGFGIFDNGKWAEIIEQPETYTIDISKELKNKLQINWK